MITFLLKADRYSRQQRRHGAWVCCGESPNSSDGTPEGLGGLLALMGAQPDLYAMYDAPQLAFSQRVACR